MRKYFLIFIASIGIYSCNSSESKVEREGEPDIIKVTNEDNQMNSAIEKANQTLDTFKNALTSNNENYSLFALKVKFKTPEGGEHMWLNEISIKDGQFYGIVNNEPEYTEEVKLGDSVRVNPNNISDWMFYNRGKIKGGYTIRVLRDKMTKEERKQFDAENGLEFE